MSCSAYPVDKAHHSLQLLLCPPIHNPITPITPSLWMARVEISEVRSWVYLCVSIPPASLHLHLCLKFICVRWSLYIPPDDGVSQAKTIKMFM